MPKQSPKEKARKLRVVQQKRMDHGDNSYKYWLMGIIGIAAIVALIVGIYSMSQEEENPSILQIATGDKVEMEYKLWIDDDKDGDVDISKDPYQGPSVFETDVYSSYHEGLPEGTGQLIHGFYLNILDMKINRTKSFTLPPGVDANGDGYDDTDPTEIVLSYGSGDLKNTTLYFWVKIMDITKGEDKSTGLKVKALSQDQKSELVVINILDKNNYKKLEEILESF